MTLSKLIILTAALLLLSGLSLIGSSLMLNARATIAGHDAQYEQQLSHY